VNVTAPGAKLLGFGMRMTGRRQEREAAVLRIRADDALVEGVELRDVAFGVHVDGASRVRLRGNHITGAPSALTGMRGDAVRLWETSDSFVEANAIAGARDVVVWYSPRNTFRRNHITRGRYGMHFMYSADNAVSDNHVEGCVVGAFVMYSRGILLHDNHFIDASGAAGMGVGLKESGNVTLRGNWFVHDTIGLYLDTSPLYLGDHNLVDGNRFLFTNAAVVFHGRAERNEFRGNELRANRRQVEVEGGGDALDSRWSGNAFDDYVGYDLDRDGVGDVPYTLRSVTGELAARFPQLRYFQGSPALGIVEAVAHLVPLVAPRTLLVDARPRFAAVAQAHGGNATSPGGS
jgi:nitrous oxidase accessory protein